MYSEVDHAVIDA